MIDEHRMQKRSRERLPEDQTDQDGDRPGKSGMHRMMRSRHKISGLKGHA